MRHDDRGMAGTELAVIAPAILLLLMLVVYAGRVSQVSGDVVRAAAEAARAASLEQTSDAATASASAVAATNLEAQGVECEQLRVEVNTASFAPGGSVAVTVTCVARMTDLGPLGVPGSRTFTARSVEVVDQYRGA